jgi:hypothetical protein
MRFSAVFLLLGLSVCANDQFNGRWNIRVVNEPRQRVWWLEVTGAGTNHLKGRFVGAPGGGMDEIPEISLAKNELTFAFEREYRVPGQQEPVKAQGIYRAKLESGKLKGNFELKGHPEASAEWVGTRAPEIADKDDGSWKEGKPVALFNGKDLSGWKAVVPGQELGWRVENGSLTNKAGANNLMSEQKFWNFRLQVEYRLGAHSNSGIGLRGRYEVQIFDDYGKPSTKQGNGALYSRIVPSENASKPAGEWQTFDIRLVGRDVTVVLNGKTIIDHKTIEGFTAVATDIDEAAPGPITLQGDHGAVEFRKIVLTPLTKK